MRIERKANGALGSGPNPVQRAITIFRPTKKLDGGPSSDPDLDLLVTGQARADVIELSGGTGGLLKKSCGWVIR